MLQEKDDMQKFDQSHAMVSNEIAAHELYPSSSSLLEEDHPSLLHSSNPNNSSKSKSSILPCPQVAMATEAIDELQRLVGYNNQSFMQHTNEIQQLQSSQYQLLHPSLNTVPISLSTISEKLWEWNVLPTTTAKDQYFNNFE